MENNDTLSDLESRMRPGQYSIGGFLGQNESLVEVLRSDDETVTRLGLTHDQIASRIEHFIRAAEKSPRSIVDEKFEIVEKTYRGMQHCPWGDFGAYSNADFTIKNLSSGETISFPGLIVHLIRDHHFYEGKESPYRVDPEKAARILEMGI